MQLIPSFALMLSWTILAAAQLGAVRIVQEIAPAATSCPSSNSDCRTAAQAAPWIAQGMYQYGIFSVNQMAAVVSLMAYESDNFEYKHNIDPGRPGQGTANMQMAPYNLKYAKQIDAVKGKVANYTSTDSLSDDELNAILALVTPDKYNFASGPWFLKTQCTQSVRDQLDANADSGFQAYMQCVGTAVTSDRLAYFDRAKKAFGIK